MRALAVDNEPEPFWDGTDETARIDAWRAAVHWTDVWGTVSPVGSLNGSSGQWLDDKILGRMGMARSDAWVTDCLVTYRASAGMRKAVRDVYEPFASDQGLPGAELLEHPSETQIVEEASARQLDRLDAELSAATPDVVVTLGNAALRVFRKLLDTSTGPRMLSTTGYGNALDVKIRGRTTRWLPVAHPGAPSRYQVAHERWQPA